MKILLKVTPTLERILAQEPGSGDLRHVGPDGFSHSSTALSQIVQPLRAAFAKPKNREGIQTRVSFSASVEFQDTQAAEIYALNYPCTLERAGEVWFVSRLNEIETIKKLQDAVIENVTSSQLGVTITIHYSIVGGAFL